MSNIILLENESSFINCGSEDFSFYSCATQKCVKHQCQIFQRRRENIRCWFKWWKQHELCFNTILHVFFVCKELVHGQYWRHAGGGGTSLFWSVVWFVCFLTSYFHGWGLPQNTNQAQLHSLAQRNTYCPVSGYLYFLHSALSSMSSFNGTGRKCGSSLG